MMTHIWCCFSKPREGRLLTSCTLILWMAIATAAFARYNPPPQPPPRDPGGSTSAIEPVEGFSSVDATEVDLTQMAMGNL